MSSAQGPRHIALGLEHHRAGRLRDAELAYRRALQLDPHDADALHLLGVLAVQAGHAAPGIDHIRRAISLRPASSEFHVNLGVALFQTGQAADAIAAYEQAVHLDPKNAEGWNLLGVARLSLGRHDEAHAAFESAVAAAPNHVAALLNLGAVNKELGRFAQAANCCRRALAHSPTMPEAHLGLAIVLGETSDFAGAIASARRACELRPQFAEAWNVLGMVHREAGDLSAAQAAHRKAVALRPGDAQAITSLASDLLDAGRLSEAIAQYRAASAAAPTDPRPAQNLLIALNYDPAATPQSLYEAHLDWARRFAPATAPAPFANQPLPGRRLRVGYMTQFFGTNPIGQFMERILQAHDRQRVELTFYDQIRREDDVTRRLAQHAHAVRKVAHLSDDQVFNLIKADRIDVLIDLAGHTNDGRPLVLARHAAPVQITYLGYCNTTGLRAVGYRLTDAIADPDGEPPHHTEQLIRLPGGFSCFAPPTAAPDVAPLPATTRAHFTFGSLHTLAKIHDGVIDAWAQILRAVPSSRLFMLRHTLRGATADRIAAAFARRGIPPDRLDLHHAFPPGGHLAAYNHIDLLLDTWPWSGHTTACEALWMGVPALTLRGNRHAGRMVASAMTHVGLSQFIAADIPTYVASAVQWAGKTDELALLRRTMRDRMLASPLCDGARAARAIEDACAAAWSAWCTRSA